MQDPSAPLHRVRFVDWSPSGITAIDFAPLASGSDAASSSSYSGLGLVGHGANDHRSLMAVGRENGTIELSTWTQEATGIKSGGSGNAKGWMIHTVRLSCFSSTCSTNVTHTT